MSKILKTTYATSDELEFEVELKECPVAVANITIDVRRVELDEVEINDVLINFFVPSEKDEWEEVFPDKQANMELFDEINKRVDEHVSSNVEDYIQAQREYYADMACDMIKEFD